MVLFISILEYETVKILSCWKSRRVLIQEWIIYLLNNEFY